MSKLHPTCETSARSSIRSVDVESCYQGRRVCRKPFLYLLFASVSHSGPAALGPLFTFRTACLPVTEMQGSQELSILVGLTVRLKEPEHPWNPSVPSPEPWREGLEAFEMPQECPSWQLPRSHQGSLGNYK